MEISNSNTAAYVKIIAKRGDTFTRTFTCTNADGSPKDFTGYSFRMHVRESRSSNRILLAFTMDSGITVSGGAFALLKSDEIMQQVPSGCHEYDIKVTKPDGTSKTWFYGEFEYDNNTTRTR